MTHPSAQGRRSTPASAERTDIDEQPYRGREVLDTAPLAIATARQPQLYGFVACSRHDASGDQACVKSSRVVRLGEMRKAFGELRRPLADPRIRAIATLVLLLVVLALAWHLVGMADHSVGMIGGACFALLAAALLVRITTGTSALPMVRLALPFLSTTAPLPIGRDPPREGGVLRM